MKRIALALALALPMCATVAPVFAQPSASLAPADRYFGRLKMSILGIRNQLKDLAERVAAKPEDAEHVYDKAVLVEDALHDWQKQFPRDPWIPKYSYALAQLYGKIASDDARVRRNDTLDWLIATYPESEYAQLPRGD
jgi:hypothetical protein